MPLMMRASSCLPLRASVSAGAKRRDPETPDPGIRPEMRASRPATASAGHSRRPTPTEVASFQFALYVDGNRTTLAERQLHQRGERRHSTAARMLPTLSTGTHTLELASFVVDGSVTIESPRSAPLRVICRRHVDVELLSILHARRHGGAGEAEPWCRSPKACLLPSDLAFAADGSIFVAERGGTVRVIRDGAFVETPALDLSPEITRREGGLARDRARSEVRLRTGWCMRSTPSTRRATDSSSRSRDSAT